MGLKLSNNGSDPLTPAVNGVFAFATRLAPGQAYSVTVSQQPTNAWQTCLVTNGTATVMSADVTVQVTCTRNEYVIGGSISGLTGQLVLQLTGSGQSSSRTLTNNVNFTFPTPVASGQQYSVTVLMQPTNQACNVTNGTSTVTNADVTNVTVVCTTNTNTYTVGGTVSNLIGSVLALSLNDGGMPFSPMMNGSFTFPTPLANGQTYNVTIATQPPEPSPMCRVVNGTGTVMNMNVTNVIVNCGGCVQQNGSCMTGGLPCCMGSCSIQSGGGQCR
jgi:hypothetical protein